MKLLCSSNRDLIQIALDRNSFIYFVYLCFLPIFMFAFLDIVGYVKKNLTKIRS